MTIPSGVVTQISDAGGDFVDMLWQIAPVLIPVTLALVVVRFIPRFIKSIGR